MNMIQNLDLQQEDTQHGRFLTFALDKEVYAVEIRYVLEIIGVLPITKVPDVPDYIKGIVNLRGKIIPVIDVRLQFNKEPIPYDEKTCIIVIEVGEISAGLIVDQVAEVLSIDDERIVPPPDTHSGSHNGFLKGIGNTENGVKIILDCEKLLETNEKQV